MFYRIAINICLFSLYFYCKFKFTQKTPHYEECSINFNYLYCTNEYHQIRFVAKFAYVVFLCSTYACVCSRRIICFHPIFLIGETSAYLPHLLLFQRKYIIVARIHSSIAIASQIPTSPRFHWNTNR